MQLDLALQKCGLTHREARVYLATLELGPARTLAIAQKAHTKRTTAYETLKRLESRGVLASHLRNNRQYFFVANPEKLQNILQEQNNIIKEITPFIAEVFRKKHRNVRVQMFTGSAGIQDIFNDTLTCHSQEILQYTSVKFFLKTPGEQFMTDYVKQRVKRGIQNFALQPETDRTPKNKTFGVTSKEYLREARYINLFFTNFVCIYDDKVAMASTEQENFGFVIESKEFSSMLRDWFWFIWRQAKT